ncbi:reverse transcriptase [Tanacetum coccineum]
MRREIKKFVRECDVCQRCKPDLSSYPGLLQPSPVPNTLWSSISMDFVEGLPKSQGKNFIMVVVNRLVLNTTPYEVLYGQTPPIRIPYVSGESRVDSVDRTLIAREEVVRALKFHLKRTQDRMKAQADKHRSERQFMVGDWVYLKLQPHQDSLNSAAGGNFLTKNTQEALTIIENKSKVQTSRNKPQVSSASGSSTQDAAITALTKQVEALVSSMNQNQLI